VPEVMDRFARKIARRYTPGYSSGVA
jgi:hypothetical protein